MWLSLCMDAPLIIDVRITAIGSRDGHETAVLNFWS